MGQCVKKTARAIPALQALAGTALTSCHMHPPSRFVKKVKPQQGVAVTILRDVGGNMRYVTQPFAFGK
jgi:hypothetical protein